PLVYRPVSLLDALPVCRDPAGDRGDADHPPAPAGYHAGKHLLHEQHGRSNMDCLRPPPLVRVDLPDGPERTRHPRVVDHEIDRRSEEHTSELQSRETLV